MKKLINFCEEFLCSHDWKEYLNAKNNAIIG